MRDIPDDLLFLLSLEHNEEAYDCLFNRYKNLLRQIAHRYTQKYCFLDYDELLEELYLIYYQSFCKYDHYKENSFFTFIYTAIENKVRTMIKRKYKNKDLILNFVDCEACDIIFDVEDETFNPERVYFSKQELAFFNKQIITDCSQNEKIVLKLLLDGLTYNEIQYHLNITKKQLYNNICRLKNKVKLIREC